MKKLTIITGLILIGIVIYIQINKNELSYYYEVFKKYPKESEIITNEYTKDYDFAYVKTYNSYKLNNSSDILNSVYTLLNNGNTNILRYCSIKYNDCLTNSYDIGSDQTILSNINNFVHPYNSFSQISFKDDGFMNIEISNDKIYSDDLIKEINTKLDSIMNEIITEDMTDEKKIEAFHNYLIKNTEYDTTKANDLTDSTHSSNTAYGVLIEGYGICSGYSDAVAIFLNKLNIKNYKINNAEHVWNLVNLNDKWLHLDITWDLPKDLTPGSDGIRRDYFLITTSRLKELNDNSHSFDTTIYQEANNS
ncbi:MAG: transglutaminase domain-containing protein [bacterium]|nr:transglutaminase domain-containing protein [bacterium]